MSGLIFLTVATVMAIFATMGFIKGARWAFISLVILFVTLGVITAAPDFIVSTLNGIYMGVMLTLKGGLGQLASGDLDAVKETLSAIEKPFEGDTEKYAALLVIGIAVGIALILAAIIKSKQGVFGLIWGLVYGYLLSSAVVPIISNVPAGTLPFPILYPAERQPGQAAAATEALWTQLSQPETIALLTWVIGGFLVLLLLLTVRRGVKKG